MSSPHPESGPPRIFVLEDEAEIARLISASLAEYGVRCEHLSNGRQLLARARRPICASSLSACPTWMACRSCANFRRAARVQC